MVKASMIKVFIEPGKYKLWQPGDGAQPKPATTQAQPTTLKPQQPSKPTTPATQPGIKQTPPPQAKPSPSQLQPSKTPAVTPLASQKQEVDSSFIVDPSFGKCLVPICSSKKFRSAKEVEEHWHKVHELQTILKTVYLCMTCNVRLDNVEELEKHYKTKHLLVGSALGFYMDSSKTKQIHVTSSVGYINPGKYKLRPDLTPQRSDDVKIIESNEKSTPAQTGFIVDPSLLKCLVPACSGKRFHVHQGSAGSLGKSTCAAEDARWEANIHVSDLYPQTGQ